MLSTDTPRLACIPSAIPQQDRQGHAQLARELFDRLALERKTLPTGYAVRFSADSLQQVARFVANERRCCPFLSFALELEPADGPLWLRMSGPEGSREVLESELSLGAKCGCSSGGACS
jgi:hypothetical protein